MIYNQQLDGFNDLNFESNKDEVKAYFEALGGKLYTELCDENSLTFNELSFSDQSCWLLFCYFYNDKLRRITFCFKPGRKEFFKLYDYLKTTIDKRYYPCDEEFKFKDSFLNRIGLSSLAIKYGGDSQSAYWTFDASPFKDNSISLYTDKDLTITLNFTHGGLEGLYKKEIVKKL